MKTNAWKRLTRSEAMAITAAGMKIVSVFETTANRQAGGAAAGEVDGVEAYREAKAIGQPEGTAIYFAVDYDAQPKDYDAIEAYLRGAGKKIPGYCVGVSMAPILLWRKWYAGEQRSISGRRMRGAGAGRSHTQISGSTKTASLSLVILLI